MTAQEARQRMKLKPTDRILRAGVEELLSIAERQAKGWMTTKDRKEKEEGIEALKILLQEAEG